VSAGPDHAAWADSGAAYLLGALDPDERAGFEAHLSACPACREEVDRLSVAADALPASARQVATPPELKDRIMAIVNAEAELLQAAGPDADRVAAVAPRRRRLAVRGPGWWSLRPGLAIAATALVLVVGVGAGIVGSGGLGGSVDTRTVPGKVTVADASAKLIVRESDHSTLVTQGLPRPSPGRVYQVWIKHEGKDPQPTDALFDVRKDGSASVDVPGSLEGVEAVMVTSEPDGGSQVPTREPVVIASPA
jgi:anti-sigma-K factor RskA